MKIKLTVLTTTLLGFFSCSTVIEPPTNWFTDRGGLNHTASLNENISLPLEVKWTSNFQEPIIGTPIGIESGLILPSGTKIRLINTNDGSTIWEYENQQQIFSTPTAWQHNKGSINRVAFIGSDGNLTCLDSDNGNEIWNRTHGVGSFNSSINNVSGLLYFNRSIDGISSSLTCVESTHGNIKWESESQNITTATPLHGFGHIFNNSGSESILPYAKYRDISGTIREELRVENFSSMKYINGVIDYDVELNSPAKIYINLYEAPQQGGQTSTIKALDLTSFREIWSTELEFQEAIGLALTQNRSSNQLVVALRDYLYGINPDNGNILWVVTYDSNNQHSSSRQIPQPVIFGSYIFHLNSNQVLKAYDLETGSEVFEYDLGCTTYSSPIIGNGHLYIGCENGILFCFGG